MKHSITLILCSCCLWSCLNEKHLAKNQTVYRVENAGPNAKISAYTNGNHKLEVTITESNGTAIVKKVASETNNFTLQQTIVASFTATGSRADLQLSGNNYFPETKDADGGVTFTPPKGLRYTENKLLFQSITFPLKIRPAITNARYKDSLPTQVESGFNAGFAVGLKRNWNYFKPDADIFGQSTRNLSANFGGFLNIGSTDVKKLTTDYTISVERKEPLISYGIFAMFGFSRINIGYSIGWDHLLTDRRKNWVYQGKLWHGVTLALDIIK